MVGSIRWNAIRAQRQQLATDFLDPRTHGNTTWTLQNELCQHNIYQSSKVDSALLRLCPYGGSSDNDIAISTPVIRAEHA